jgi:hypothetical protein
LNVAGAEDVRFAVLENNEDVTVFQPAKEMAGKERG